MYRHILVSLDGTDLSEGYGSPLIGQHANLSGSVRMTSVARAIA